MVPANHFHGLFIEFKKPRHLYSTDNAAKRELKEHQLETLKRLNLMGYHARVAFGCEEALSILRSYLEKSTPATTFYSLDLLV